MKPTHEHTILQDYLHAVRAPTNLLLAFLREELESLQETFDYSKGQPMEVIEEQQTDREEDAPSSLRKEFNAEIRKMMGMKGRMEEILNVYKVEIKGMAKSIIELEEQLTLKKKEALQLSRKSSKPKPKNAEEDLKIRDPPQPLPPNKCPNCLKLEEDKTKWKTLSLKIEEFKRKNSSFEAELKQKESLMEQKEEEIGALKGRIAVLQKGKSSEGEEERKKLKKDNTSLRGEKVLLTNQLSSLRKQLAEKVELNDVQDIEIKKLRLEIDNLNSSLLWHNNNLNELRNSHSRGLSQEQREQAERVEALVRANRAMAKAIEEQEGVLEGINSKTRRVEEGWGRECQRYEKKVGELESILEDKNETIVRLKTSSRSEKQSSYQSDMIKVLNKKLAEKEEVIRSLQDQLHSTTQ